MSKSNVVRISDYQYKNMYKALVDIDADSPVKDIKEWLDRYNLANNLVQSKGSSTGDLKIEFEVATLNKNELIASLSDFYSIPISDLSNSLDTLIYK
mgnify:FL=1